MKTFAVEIDFTMSKTIWVEAKNIEEAKKVAEDKVQDYPHYYYTKGSYVGYEITDINEYDE